SYAAWGLVYGVIISGLAILGTIAGVNGHYLPGAGGLLLIGLAGVLSCLLWTLLALGVGALLGSTTGTIVLLVIYAVTAEPIIDLFFRGHIAGILPNGAADGLTGSTAAKIILNGLHSPTLLELPQEGFSAFQAVVRVAAGAIGAFDWWASGLIFLGWTVVFFLAGMLVNQ